MNFLNTHESSSGNLRPHRRRNALTGQWVLVSPHRNLRPWLGASDEASQEATVLSHDPTCYLCAGNLRATGQRNPDYTGTYVFDNDYPALKVQASNDLQNSPVESSVFDTALFEHMEVQGECKVVCFSPDHGKTLAEMNAADIEAVINTWCEETHKLSERWRWVQVFENKGATMGCSNPHPHSQIWATNYLPSEAVLEDRCQRDYFAAHGRPLLLDYAHKEATSGDRTVVRTKHWLVVVPYWAAWPFETLLLPLQPVPRQQQLSTELKRDLAVALRELTVRYDNLFRCSFPYSAGWHGAPGAAIPTQSSASSSLHEEDQQHWQLHAHFYPPLLRSASVRKFMVGFEMLAEAQRDLTPEQAAAHLRACSDIHFRQDVKA